MSVTLKHLVKSTNVADVLGKIEDPLTDICLDWLHDLLGKVRKYTQSQTNMAKVAAMTLSGLDYISTMRPYITRFATMANVNLKKEWSIALTERAPVECEKKDVKPTVGALEAMANQDELYIKATIVDSNAKAMLQYLKDKREELIMSHHLAKQLLSDDRVDEKLNSIDRSLCEDTEINDG